MQGLTFSFLYSLVGWLISSSLFNEIILLKFPTLYYQEDLRNARLILVLFINLFLVMHVRLIGRYYVSFLYETHGAQS